jgi:acyl-CoA synthetase (AMP-forming)/AMP-acid ligase II
VTYLSPADHRAGRHLGSVGHAIPGVQVQIRDPLDRPLPDGEVGEVCVRGPNVMLGYWNREEATREVLSGDGWYRTGDAGRLDGGYLYLADRLKDMIVSGGENVYSIEVENAIALHPDVREVAVVARPDERWGERVHAIIVPGGRREARRSGDRRALPPADRRLQAAALVRIPRRAAAQVARRQGAQGEAASPGPSPSSRAAFSLRIRGRTSSRNGASAKSASQRSGAIIG